MNVEVTKLIDSLRGGTMSLDQVAEQFRQRSWPRQAPATKDYLQSAAAAEDDPEPYVPNSFDDVVAAYDAGRISDHEYEVLSGAVAEAKRAEDEGRGA